MGKKQHSKDQLYLTNSESSAQVGRKQSNFHIPYKTLPFDCCAISFRPFETPMCTADGVVFDLLNIVPYLKKFRRHPVTGAPLAATDLIRLQFHKNGDGKYHCPVTFKVFNQHTHIVAVRQTGNVYAYDAVRELNIKAKCMRDLLDDTPFARADVITIQDPSDGSAREIERFSHVKEDLSAAAVRKDDNVRHSDATSRVMSQLTKGAPSSSSAAASSSAPVPGAIGEVTREALKEMHRALDALSAGDLTLALAWVAEHGDAPVQSGRRPRAAEGTLAYELERLPLSATLHTLRFAQLLSSEGEAGGAPAALAYARLHLSLPSWRQLQRKLLGALAYARRLDSSPYASLLSAELREGAAARFRGECMQTLGLPRTSALQTVFDVGRHVLPKLLKCAAVLPAKYAASWKAGGMLPVDVDLPNWAVFHSIFVCPISKEVATPSNPPMMLPCGHALCLSSVAKLARGSRSVRFKCPYCPAEASLAMALELKF